MQQKKTRQSSLKIKFRKCEKVHLIHISCIKIPATTYESFLKILKNPRHPVIRDFVVSELSELNHPIGDVAPKLDLTTFFYEPTEEFILDADHFYGNIKLSFKYRSQK